MNEEISALLVQSQRSPNMALKLALHGTGIRTHHVRSCDEARQILAQPPCHDVIFADAALPDGTWEDIVSLAEACSRPLNVVVVSPELDVDLYIKVLEGGAFDFIVPPFMGADLLHIMNCTAWKGLTQERPPTSGRAAA
jgi:DNA-binding NtrC family response regulator